MKTWMKWALGAVATLAMASAIWEPLTAQERRARAGLQNRQVTLR